VFLRLFGILLVMAGCVGIGFFCSAREASRVQDLQEFKKALLILLAEIDYMRSTLAVACANIAKRVAPGVGAVFTHYSALLEESTGETAYQLWLDALNAHADRLFIAPEDKLVLEDFGKTLGYLDKGMQKNAIECTVAYIDEKTTALSARADKNKRMYHSLGVIGGLLIIVVLW